MKNLVIGSLLLLLVGCGTPDPSTSQKATDKYKVICIDNVTYIMYQGSSAAYRGYGYLSIKLNENSKIVSCIGD